MTRTTGAPGTPRLLRAINDRAALELLLRRGPLTRTQIGELTGLSKVTASQLIGRLEERGLVTPAGEQAGGRGPNARLYAVTPGSGYVVGIEVGPDHVVAACADITGVTRGRSHRSTEDTDDPVGVVHRAVVEAVREAGTTLSAVRRIVLGTPGLVDPATGDLAFVVDMPRWHRGLLAALRADLGRPVVLENDVNLAAAAEAKDGVARDVGDFLLVWVDRGVGLAVTLSGRLHRGATGAAGEIGYLPVAGADVPRSSGRRVTGGLQRLVGGAAVRRLAREHGFRGDAAAAVRLAAESGPDGSPLLDELARRLALGVVAACVVLDPSLVVLAGAVGRAGGAELAERVRAAVATMAPVTPRVAVTGVAAEPVLRGALLTALETARDEVFGSTA